MAKPKLFKATLDPPITAVGNGTNQTKPTKTTSTTANSSSNSHGTQQSSSSSSSSSSLSMTMIIFRVVVAICALSLGLLSPIVLDIYREQQEIYSVILVEEESSTSQATTKPKRSSSSGFGKVFVAGEASVSSGSAAQRDLSQVTDDDRNDQPSSKEDGSDASNSNNNGQGNNPDSCQADQEGAATESVDVDHDERKLNVGEDDEDDSSTTPVVEYRSTRYACNEEVLSHFLHHDDVFGMHVVCVQQEADGLGGRLILFQNAVQLSDEDDELWEISSGTDPLTWGWIKEQLVNELELTPTDDLHQPWAIFSPNGEERLRDESDPDTASIEGMLDYGLFLVFQGGQWIWPGVAKGYKRKIHLEWVATPPPSNVANSNDDATTTTKVTTRTTATLETLSLNPLVLSVEGFLSEEECDLIQTLAKPHMQYSSVTFMARVDLPVIFERLNRPFYDPLRTPSRITTSNRLICVPPVWSECHAPIKNLRKCYAMDTKKSMTHTMISLNHRTTRMTQEH
jgi:hypothetical protein